MCAAELGHPATLTMAVTGHADEGQMRRDYSLVDSTNGPIFLVFRIVFLGLAERYDEQVRFWNGTPRAHQDVGDGPRVANAGLQAGVSAVLYPPTEHRQPVCVWEPPSSTEDGGGGIRPGP